MDYKVINLDVNKQWIDNIAQNKFKKVANDERSFDFFESIVKQFEFKAYFVEIDEIAKNKNEVILNDIRFSSEEFVEVPKEILSGAFVYLISINNYDKIIRNLSGVYEETMADIVGSLYIESIKESLREYIAEDELIGLNSIPGVNLDISYINQIDKILNFKSLGVEYTDHYYMKPTKSICGLFLKYSQNHPPHIRNCEECMSRGYGCNLCEQGE